MSHPERLAFILVCWGAASSLADVPKAEAPIAGSASQDFMATIVGAPKEAPLKGEALERRTEEVSRELRCPVCQGSSVGDSPSSTARHMKEQVRESLAAGYSEEQVLSYFEASYGEFVRLTPKAEGFTTFVWMAPALLFFLGAVAAAVWYRRRPRSTRPVADDPELERWLTQVHTMVGKDSHTTGAAR
jgi:cytochrome c-type biogenesis protein CcmH